MTPLALFQTLRGLGVHLSPQPDGTVRCRARKGLLTPELLAAMQTHKLALHDLVEAYEERAAIFEYEAGLPRAQAEALSWEVLVQDEAAREVSAAVARAALARRCPNGFPHVWVVRGTLPRLCCHCNAEEVAA